MNTLIGPQAYLWLGFSGYRRQYSYTVACIISLYDGSVQDCCRSVDIVPSVLGHDASTKFQQKEKQIPETLRVRKEPWYKEETQTLLVNLDLKKQRKPKEAPMLKQEFIIYSQLSKELKHRFQTSVKNWSQVSENHYSSSTAIMWCVHEPNDQFPLHFISLQW